MSPAVFRTLTQLEEQRQEQLTAKPRTSPATRDERMLAVGPETARFLNTLIRATGAKRVLEIGGSMGYSTIWQGEAVRQNGGLLTTLESVPTKLEALARRIEQAELGEHVRVVPGDARAVIPTLEGPFDFVLIDAWKDDYPLYFDLVFPRLVVGGLIVADNITHPTPQSEGIFAYIEKARTHPDAQTQLVPIGSGLELTIKLR